MKLILCLALIAVGVYGLILEFRRRVRKKIAIMDNTLANYFVAKRALAELIDKELRDSDEFLDLMEQLNHNTIEVITMACGTKYVEESDWLMKEYDKKKATLTT